MKRYDLVGLTNALMDVTVKVTDDDIKRLGLRKGLHVGLKDLDEGVLDFLAGKALEGGVRSVGGSPANVVCTASALGLHTAILGSIGDDFMGKNYEDMLRDMGVESHLSCDENGGRTGVCYALITPDGERTFVADMGVSRNLEFYYSTLNHARMFHTSAYELRSYPEGVICCMDMAKEAGARISFDLADPQMLVGRMKSSVEDAIRLSDILFTSVGEAQAFLGADLEHQIYGTVEKLAPVVVLKQGSLGSAVYSKRGCSVSSIGVYSPYPRLVNTNGAGDAYAAGFLTGYFRAMSPEECGHFGSFVASRVCSREAAHLSLD